jgi:hypothetical protein
MYDQPMGSWSGGIVEPPPYPDGAAPFGGELITFHALIRIWYRRTVRQWDFTGTDPHHLHQMRVQSLPDGRYSLDASADREGRVWLFATQAEAEAAAKQMRTALSWRGTWTQVA